MTTDRFQPDASLRRVTSPEARGLSGKRGDRVVVDDPLFDATDEAVDAMRKEFLGRSDPDLWRSVYQQRPEPRPDPGVESLREDRGPLAHRGRDSIPKSHRAEGRNFVD